VDFDVFEKQTLAACQAGASGFLAGRAIWKEAVGLSPEERSRFVAQTCATRLGKLKDVAQKHARPWTDFYQPIAAVPDWFKTYA
jgi:tagatose 1,6-diphosphate aldolase